MKKNHLKRMQAYFAGNVRMWRWESVHDPQEKQDNIHYVNMEVRKSPMMKNYIRQRTSLIPQMANYPMDWMLCCRALCKSNNDVWVETEMVSFKNMALTSFSDHYFDMRDKVLDAVQRRHIIDLGWIAHTTNKKTTSLDSNWELYALGEPTEERQMLWNYSEKLVKDRMTDLAA